jgi:type II secretory pathway pseudopilin PulG
MYDAPQAPLTPKEAAPGAKAAFQLGLWSVLLNVLCGCFPVAIPLGIAAIVKHGKAERAAWAEPDRYEQPGSTGKVLGIVGLCLTVVAFMVIGIISAISIPALLGQRDRARSMMVRSQVYSATAEAARVADELSIKTGHPASPQEVVETLLAEEQMKFPAAKNAYNPTAAAYKQGREPMQDGEITLDPQPQYQDLQMGTTHPAIVIRGRFRNQGRSDTVEKVVSID